LHRANDVFLLQHNKFHSYSIYRDGINFIVVIFYCDGINSIATRSVVPPELPGLHFANAGGMTDIVAQGFNLGV